MIRSGENVFVDTGAWIALFEKRDPFHERAAESWALLLEKGGRPVTSVPVILETFTFIDRRGSRALALEWRDALRTVPRFEILDCSASHLDEAWSWLTRKGLHKLGIVDATSFTLMRRHRIKVAFAFDVHFGQAGFRFLG